MTDGLALRGQSESHPPPLVAVHDSWISVDPVLGCVANCEYCYLGPMQLRGARPTPRATIAECLDSLEALPTFAATSMPVCIGNYTDMLMRPIDRPFFLEFLREFAARHPTRTTCVVTKASVDDQLADELSRAASSLVIFLSQSFASESEHASLERGPTARFDQTLASMRVLASRPNLTAIHFWRPFMTALNPLGDIPNRIDALHEAGSTASVVVGFKLASERKNVSSRMTSLSDPDGDLVTVPGDELFFEKGFELAVQHGRGVGYPVLRNTSCSLAVHSSELEALGTAWGPLSESRCRAASCPEAQRAICESDDPRWPEQVTVSRLAAALSLSSDVVVDQTTGCVGAGSISEGDLNGLTHALRLTVTARSVIPVKVWAGATLEFSTSVEGHDIVTIEPARDLGLEQTALSAIERLRGITGFVTTLQDGDAEASSIFARYDHVQRVVWLTGLLAEGTEFANEALRYAWVHDINRWAFAHNAERGRFDQAANIDAYFSQHPCIGAEERQQLKAFHARDIAQLSEPALIACTADMIAGTVEDPILLTAGLNVSPSVLADPTQTSLIDFQDPTLHARLSNLGASLHVLQAPELFRREMAALFSELAHEVVRSFGLRPNLREAAVPLFEQIRRYKEAILRPVIFPINNDLVCNADRIRQLVVERLFGLLSDEASQLLLALDEDHLVAHLLAVDALNQDELSSLYPELTNVAERAGVPALLTNV